MRILLLRVLSFFILLPVLIKSVKYKRNKKEFFKFNNDIILFKTKKRLPSQWKSKHLFMNSFSFLKNPISMFSFYTKEGIKNVVIAKGKLRVYMHSLENIERTLIKDVFKINIDKENAEHKLKVCGWIKSLRTAGKGSFAFLDVNDGSYFQNLQIVVNNDISNFEHVLKTSTDDAIECVGQLKPSVGGKQKVELSIVDKKKGHYIKLFRDEDIEQLEEAYQNKNEKQEMEEKQNNGEKEEKEQEQKKEEEQKNGKEEKQDRKYYAISKKYHTKQYLRNFPHLRGRTKLYSSLFRLKSDLILTTFEFFKKKKFTYINTPVLTSNDCEGGGKLFYATTLLSNMNNITNMSHISKINHIDKDMKKDIYKNIEKNMNQNMDQNMEQNMYSDINNNIDNDDSSEKIDKDQIYTKKEIENEKNTNIFESDFFKTPCYLNVSSQLALECLCCSLGNVFTMNHCFRADNSNTSRHLSEFLMLEIEMAFANLKDIITLAEEYIKELISFALFKSEDISYLNEYHNKHIKTRLEKVLNQNFVTITYEEIIHILQKEKKIQKKNHTLSDAIWGKDLTMDQQKFLSNEYFQSPLIIINYPKSIKPFYMKLNKDKKTVACMDIIFPDVGEIIGGSEREIRLSLLQNKMKEANLNTKLYEPYLQLRKYGNMPHAGFGLGIDRLIMFIASIDNIRDVVPFPRYPNSLFM